MFYKFLIPSLQIERNFRLLFYIKLVSLKCNDIKIVYPWSDEQQKVAPKWPKNIFWTFSTF